MTTNNKKLITHNGTFHADDIFACAILALVLDARGEKYEIIRTRDPKIIAEGDYVFDVGGEYDSSRNRFDHHQVGGAGKYNADIPYASAGLVWKNYGVELCGSEEIASMIEGQIIIPIDAADNGIDISKPLFKDIYPFSIQSVCNLFRPTWKETDLSDNEQFLKTATFAKEIIKRSIISAQDSFEAGESIKKSYQESSDKRLVILDKSFDREDILPILTQYKEPIYFIYPKTTQGWWKLEGVRKSLSSFEMRKNLPKEWAGLRDVDLQAVTGVSDAVFCHNGLFLIISKTKEGALALAEKALTYKE